ncbi:MAG: hypothetical protein ACYC9R_12690 [Nitrosotalea sp.]
MGSSNAAVDFDPSTAVPVDQTSFDPSTAVPVTSFGSSNGYMPAPETIGASNYSTWSHLPATVQVDPQTQAYDQSFENSPAVGDELNKEIALQQKQGHTQNVQTLLAEQVSRDAAGGQTSSFPSNPQPASQSFDPSTAQPVQQAVQQDTQTGTQDPEAFDPSSAKLVDPSGGETPNTALYAYSNLQGGAADILGYGAQIAGSVIDAGANLVGHPGAADSLIDMGKSIVAHGGDLPDSMAPEQAKFKNANTLQRVVGVGARLPALLAFGVAAPAVAGVESGWGQATDAADHGEVYGKDLAALAIGFGTGYGAMKIPLDHLSTNFGKAIAYGIGTNIVAGNTNDLMMNSLLSDTNPDLAKKYAPSWQKFGDQVITGTIFGAWGRYVNMAGELGVKAQIQDFKDNYYGDPKNVLAQDGFLTQHLADLKVFLDGTLPSGHKYSVPEGQTESQHLGTLLKPADIVTDPTTGEMTGVGHPDATVQNLLDIYSQYNPEVAAATPGYKPEQDIVAVPIKAYANYLSVMARDLGLENTKVTNLTGTDLQRNDASGVYDQDTDTISLHKGISRIVVMHEIGHALLMHGVGKFEELQDHMINNQGYTPTPDEVKLQDRFGPINDAFTSLKAMKNAEVQKTEGMDIDARLAQTEANGASIRALGDQPITADQAIRAEADAKFNRLHYGYSDLHEFISDFISNKEFRDSIGQIPISKEQLPGFYPDRTNRYQARFAGQAMTDAVKNSFGVPVQGTMLDPLTDSIHSLFETESAADRTIVTGAKTQARNEAIATKLNEGPTSNIARGLLQKIKYVMDLSGVDSNMFKTRLLAEFPSSKSWQDFVLNMSDSMMTNRKYFENLKTDTSFLNLTRGEQRFSSFPMTVDDLAQHIAGKYLNDEGRVIKPILGKDDNTTFGEWFDAPAMYASEKAKRDTPTGQFTKFVVDKGMEYLGLGNKVRSQLLAHFQPFNKLTRASQLNVYRELISQNSVEGRAALVARKLQWQDEATLQQRGLTPEEINAFAGVTRGLDHAWDILNQTRQRQGLDKLDRIPGYMPQIYEGAYKAMVKLTDPNGVPRGTVLVRHAETRWGIMKQIKEVESGKYDSPTLGKFSIDYDPVSGHPYRIRGTQAMGESIGTNMNEFLQQHFNQLNAAPEVLEALQKMEQDAMVGINKHMLERSDVSGFIGSQGINDSLMERLGIGDPKNNKILALNENYVHSVSEYYRNVLYGTEVLGPLMTRDTDATSIPKNYADLFKNTPAFMKWITEYGFNYMGHPLNHAKLVDNIPERALKYAGLDPYLARTAVSFLRNMMSKIALRANIGFYASNAFQHTMVVGMLDLAGAQRSIEGKYTDMAVGTYAKTITKMMKGNLTNEDRSVLQWAQDAHILDENVEQAMQGKTKTPFGDFANTVTGGKINPVIEKYGRTVSFLTAYNHMKDWYPSREMALEAARKITDMTMVNYSREARPLMFQNTGLVGQALSPFAVFRNQYFNNFDMMFELIAKNPTNVRAYLPFAATFAAFTMTAGAVGTIGFTEYNRLMDLINKIWPSLNAPHLDSLVQRAGLPDWMMYGMPSELTKLAIPGGINISGSMGAPEPSTVVDSPLVDFVKSIVGVGGAAFEDALYKLGMRYAPAPANDYYSAGKRLMPSILRGQYEELFKGDQGGQEVGYKSGSLEGYVERDANDKMAYDLTGKYSIPESRRRAAERQIQINDKVVTDSVKELVSVATDSAMNINSKMTADEAYKAALQIDPSILYPQFYKMVTDEMFKRMTSVKTRSTGMDYKSMREYTQRTQMGQ